MTNRSGMTFYHWHFGWFRNVFQVQWICCKHISGWVQVRYFPTLAINKRLQCLLYPFISNHSYWVHYFFQYSKLLFIFNNQSRLSIQWFNRPWDLFTWHYDVFDAPKNTIRCIRIYYLLIVLHWIRKFLLEFKCFLFI